MSRKWILTGLIVVAGAAVLAVDSKTAAPDFTRKDAKGAQFKLSDYRGKVVLLNFWATSCLGCRIEIPWLVEFSGKYRDLGLVVIGVSIDEDGWESVRPFLKEKKIDYAVVLGGDGLADRYRVEAIPMTLLIDRQGKIAASHTGLVGKAILEAEIIATLRER